MVEGVLSRLVSEVVVTVARGLALEGCVDETNVRIDLVRRKGICSTWKGLFFDQVALGLCGKEKEKKKIDSGCSTHLMFTFEYFKVVVVNLHFTQGIAPLSYAHQHQQASSPCHATMQIKRLGASLILPDPRPQPLR